MCFLAKATFSCAYFSDNRREKGLRSISEVIRCSRLALRSDLGSCEIKKKIDALSEGRDAIFAPCLFTQEADKSSSLYVCQESENMERHIHTETSQRDGVA